MFLTNLSRTSLVLMSVVFLGSCDKNSKDFVSVSVTTVFEDSLSIHAIHPIDTDRVWFAANKGQVGLIDKDIPKLATIKYDNKYLHFRSLSVTNDAVFVLSIASPAVLYKIGFDGNEATNIETVYVETGERVFYNSMKFWNDTDGIAMGDPIENCLTILLTRDGGNTWRKLSCDELPEANRGEVAFSASNSNIAVYGDHVWIATGGSTSRIMHSSDKGNTWNFYETPIASSEVLTGIHAISFWDEQNGIVVGGSFRDQENKEATIAITGDGGKTWKLSDQDHAVGYRSSVRYVPNGNGKKVVALGPSGISYSSDGGRKWKDISDEGFFALEFVNDSIAYASGKNRISKLTFKK